MKNRWSLRRILAVALISLSAGFHYIGQAVEKEGLGLAEAAVKEDTLRAAAKAAKAANENESAESSKAVQEVATSGEHESGSFLHDIAHHIAHHSFRKAFEYTLDKSKETFFF